MFTITPRMCIMKGKSQIWIHVHFKNKSSLHYCNRFVITSGGRWEKYLVLDTLTKKLNVTLTLFQSKHLIKEQPSHLSEGRSRFHGSLTLRCSLSLSEWICVQVQKQLEDTLNRACEWLPLQQFDFSHKYSTHHLLKTRKYYLNKIVDFNYFLLGVLFAFRQPV